MAAPSSAASTSTGSTSPPSPASPRPAGRSRWTATRCATRAGRRPPSSTQASFEAADALIRSGAALQNLLTLNNLVSGTVTDQALGTTSYSARTRPIANRTSADRSRQWIDQRLGQVRVSAPRAVTLSSSSGQFQATITNGLDQPVTVSLEAQSDDPLNITGPRRVEVPATGRVTRAAHRAHRRERHPRRDAARHRQARHARSAPRTSMSIRSAQLSNVIWLFLAIGAALLFGAIGVRLFRRIRNARRTPADSGRPRRHDRADGRRADRGQGARGSREPVTEQPIQPPVDEAAEQSSLLSHSAVMAAGTTLSRLSGFVRAALLSYALGASVHADIFNVANSLPNMLYILLAGGIFNAVLVPQLVRSMRHDPDRGDAYTSRVITVAGLFLVAVTVLLIVAAPLIRAGTGQWIIAGSAAGHPRNVTTCAKDLYRHLQNRLE